MNRIFGIETEYGITLEGAVHVDTVKESIELIRSFRAEDWYPAWDYSLEDPYQDARGFRAKQLHEHPDEKMFQKKDRNRNLSHAEIKSDLILSNGARLYNDHAHPEYSTPECSRLIELIAYDKAGERILLQCAHRRSEALEGQSVLLYKNNTDFHGHSYGCHDNYLMRRDVPFDYIQASLIPFFVTRQIFAGAGKVGIENESGLQRAGWFQLAQRSDFFAVEASVDTMSKRPIINTRDEPHADPKQYRRLHGIVGDANMSEYATALKVGTTALVLDLIEMRLIGDGVAIRNPVEAIRLISHDPRYEWLVERESGGTISAIDIQRHYLDLARHYFHGRDSDTAWTLDAWESTLDQLGRDPLALADRLDWVAKRWLLETFIEEENAEWDDPWIQSLDLEYHNIDPDSGLFYELQRITPMQRLVSDEDIEQAITLPPRTTRAYFRGRVVDRFRSDIESIQWDNVRFKLDGRTPSIDLKHLIQPDIVETYNQILDASDSVADMLAALESVTRDS